MGDGIYFGGNIDLLQQTQLKIVVTDNPMWPDSPIIHSRYKIQRIIHFSGPEFVLDLRSGNVYISGYWRYI